MAGNANLGAAKAVKNDEFYTQWNDIENEMQAYLEYDPDVFRGKTVLLPCDDPAWSNFTKYFALNFEKFGLKKLISTSCAPRFNPDADKRGRIYVLERGEDASEDGRLNKKGLKWDCLEGDGNFRSDEVTALRDEADMVITNPPFSLFREFVEWLIEGDVEFAVIGNMNAVTYKEVFPLVKENRLWLGATRDGGGAMWFRVPDNAPVKSTGQRTDPDGTRWQTIGSSAWFTNIEHGRRHEPLVLMTMEDNLIYGLKAVKELGYPKYENYDAIEVPKVLGIPSNYEGAMGVPITFLGKYNPEQFEILGASLFDATPIKEVAKPGDQFQQGGLAFYIREGESNLRRLYFRIIIRHRNPEREESRLSSRSWGGRSSLRCKRELSHIL